jgi:hypothetical protein
MALTIAGAVEEGGLAIAITHDSLPEIIESE